jgi:hypothetical protein
MRRFLNDFEPGKPENRNVVASLLRLPFADSAFRMALVSDLRFLYSEQLVEAAYIESALKLLRVAGLPALMWTDTAEFRNPHYHRPTDTPETLDYGFLAEVARLLVHAAIG